MTIRVPQEHAVKFLSLSKKMQQNALAPNDIAAVTQVFSKVAQFPLAYILPRKTWEANLDDHQVTSEWNFDQSPQQMLQQLGRSQNQAELFKTVAAQAQFLGEWKWDFDSAFQLSHSEKGLDAYSLFSIARRFHLLDSVESNQTDSMKVYVESLKGNSDQYKNAACLIVRQNHYVTERCYAALSPALKIAQSADHELQEFIQAEMGHDQILGKAILEMGFDPKAVALSPTVEVLMSLFQAIAKTNFLAFAMVVDMFERSAHTDDDPLAELLMHGGFDRAAAQINIHKEINDSGGHENVALSFISSMGPLSEEYARQALQLTELATNVMHGLSRDLLNTIKAQAKD